MRRRKTKQEQPKEVGKSSLEKLKEEEKPDDEQPKKKQKSN